MENVILFGASNLGEYAYNNINNKNNICFFSDNCSEKWGKKFCGIDIISIDELCKYKNYNIVITSMYWKEIYAQLNKLEFKNIYVYTTNNEKLEEHNKEYPESIWIETTNCCNEKCKFCFHYNNSMVRKKGYMSLELYKKIINEVKIFNPKINLHHSGEPFLHKDLYKFIDYANKFNLDVGLTTNGTLIDKDNYYILKTGINRLNISLAGVDKEDYEFIRKNSSFNEIEEKINKLANLKKMNNFNTKIYINVTKTEKNKDKIQRFINRFEDIDGIEGIIIRDLMTWSKSVDISEIKVNNSENINSFKEYTIVKIDNVHPINFSLCNSAYKGLGVLWDGSVVPCCLDFQGYNNLGNLSEESFISIYNGEKRKKLLNDLQHRNLIRENNKFCKNCMSL